MSDYKALADTLREARRERHCWQPHMPYDLCSHPLTEYALVPADRLPTIISALEQMAELDAPVDQNEIAIGLGDNPPWLTNEDVRLHWSEPESTA